MRRNDPRRAPEITFLKEKCFASEVANSLNARMVGDDIPIYGVATYISNTANSLSYQVAIPQDKQEYSQERVVLCSNEIASSISSSTKLIVEDPQEAFMLFLSRSIPEWAKTVKTQADKMKLEVGEYEVHKTALIEDGAIIGKNALIESYVVIKSGVIVGENAIVASGTILGACGPALYKTRRRHQKVLSWAQIHFGTLQIYNNVEIGANSVILKGMLGRTCIGQHTVLGNMVHVGHGCEIREKCWLAARVTVTGHVFIDENVSIGAGVIVRDNIDIGKNVSIGMGSVVVKSIDNGKCVLGIPAKETDCTFNCGPLR